MNDMEQRGWEMDMRNMGCNQNFDTGMVLAKGGRGSKGVLREISNHEVNFGDETMGEIDLAGNLVELLEAPAQEEGDVGSFPLGHQDKRANFIFNANELRDVPIIQQRKGNGRVKQGIRVGREGSGVEMGRQRKGGANK
ncbi:hypothetical protein LIER_23357 [Lithospermum erythrorhizon]|uniref:Uncharacterized protein n=1 Tax=Lithospermum erythrorhizon TaxID=34254 RepID=A0AAV3QYE7_LITER